MPCIVKQRQLKPLKRVVTNIFYKLKRTKKKLLEQIIFNCNVSKPISTHETVEQNRGRDETRRVFVYDDLYGIDTSAWIGVQQIVKVERITYTNKKELPSLDSSYFISRC